MKDIKDFINTKDDILALKSKFPREVLKYLKEEQGKAIVWAEVKTLDKKQEGIEDGAHRLEQKGGKWVQLEKRINNNAHIFKGIGFSEAELEGVIKKIELGIV